MIATHLNSTLEILTVVADGFSMDLRTTNLWFERLESIYSHTNKNIEILSLALFSQFIQGIILIIKKLHLVEIHSQTLVGILLTRFSKRINHY
jgi:hypothetical protein